MGFTPFLTSPPNQVGFFLAHPPNFWAYIINTFEHFGIQIRKTINPDHPKTDKNPSNY